MTSLSLLAGRTESLSFNYRLCNCESGDSMWRADAGVISDMGVLPIRLLNFTNPGTEGASGFVTVGPIFCSEQELGM